MSDEFLNRIQKLSEIFWGAAINVRYAPANKKEPKNNQIDIPSVHEFQKYAQSDGFTSGSGLSASASSLDLALGELEEKIHAPGSLFYSSEYYEDRGGDMFGPPSHDNWPPRYIWETNSEGTPQSVAYDEDKVLAWLKQQEAALTP